METYTPEQAAAAIGNISASTIRNWCKIYAAILSEAANPTAATARQLSEADVATLQRVKLLRDNRMAPDDIVATLQQAATKPTTPHVTIEGIATPPQNVTDAPHGDSLLPVALSSMASRQDATDKRIDVLQQTVAALEQQQAARVNALVTGIVLGGAAVLIVVALVFGMAQ